jgi:hypothetical protein
MDEAPYVEIKTSPGQAEELFDRLLHDGEFREQLERGGASAVSALNEYGITVTADLVEGGAELPSAEELERALAAMDKGEFAPETADIKFMKFWPIFWAIMKFRKFRSAAT